MAGLQNQTLGLSNMFNCFKPGLTKTNLGSKQFCDWF